MGNIFSGLGQNYQAAAILALLILAGYIFFKKKSPFNRSTSIPILESFSKDVTRLAKEGKLDPVIGREEEIKHLIMVLSRRTKNNVVLVGEAGVGKTAIVEGLAQKIADKKVPPELFAKRVLLLDLNSLLAGTKYRGEFEDRVKKITEEISLSSRNIILFIDEVHNLIEAESSGESISVGDIFKPAMARGDLQIVGATTRREYDEYFEKDDAFKRRMQPIFVSEPSAEEALEILRGIKKKYADFHKVEITDEALGACVIESKKVFPGKSLPDRAIDLMDEAASKVRMENAKNSSESEIPKVLVKDVMEVEEEYKNEQPRVARTQ
ncbi:MAG: AAA family ATPase [Parcubacteria group bacterium]